MKKGRVIKSTGSWYIVNADGQLVHCRLPGRFRLKESDLTNPIAVGDIVDITMNDDGTGGIENIHPRKNYIIRQATHGRRGSHIIASNLDYAFVIQSIQKPKLNEGFIDRFLVTCEAYNVKPVIVINKMDLAKDSDIRFLADLSPVYEKLNYPILLTSIDDEDSLEELKSMLKGNTSAFIGPSGVGKTSLLNTIDPEFHLKVAAVSESSNKGKHTTTFAQLIELNIGAYLVDTPGIREFGLVNIEPWELSLFFPEMLEPRKQCRFNTCTHIHEPDCGVAAAYDEGIIDASRYNSYINILESLEKEK
ncbi:MAG: ribosome small subunit-dependent GTPase A [Balneolaceae bacterium]